jgi:hypothetical protein
MALYRASIDTERPREEVFTHPRRSLNDEGRKTPLIYRIVEYAPPRTVTFLSENSTVISRDRIKFDSTAAVTRVTCDADLALKGPFRISDPPLGLAFTHVGGRALTGLTRSVRNIARRARTITVYTERPESR